MRDTGKERRGRGRQSCNAVLLTYRSDVGLLAGLFGTKNKGPKPAPVRNISSDGLCFLSRRGFKRGQRLRMTVRFGQRKGKVRASGEVKWCGEGAGIYPYAVGVEFTEVGPRSWQVLNNLNEYLLSHDEWKKWRLRSQERSSLPFGDASRLHEDSDSG